MQIAREEVISFNSILTFSFNRYIYFRSLVRSCQFSNSILTTKFFNVQIIPLTVSVLASSQKIVNNYISSLFGYILLIFSNTCTNICSTNSIGFCLDQWLWCCLQSSSVWWIQTIGSWSWIRSLWSRRILRSENCRYENDLKLA